MSCADFFSQSTFWKNSFRNTTRVSNNLDPDHARQLVRPDLDPNCLQIVSVDNISRHTVKRFIMQIMVEFKYFQILQQYLFSWTFSRKPPFSSNFLACVNPIDGQTIERLLG